MAIIESKQEAERQAQRASVAAAVEGANKESKTKQDSDAALFEQYRKRLETMTPTQKAEFIKTKNEMRLGDSVTRSQLVANWSKVFTAIDSKVVNPTPLSTLLPDSNTPGQETYIPTKEAAAAGQEADSVTVKAVKDAKTAVAPTAPSITPSAPEKSTTLQNNATQEVKQPTATPSAIPVTQNYYNITKPDSSLTEPPATPTVPTEDKGNASAAAQNVLKKRRGRASTIGLGARSSDTNLSSNIVKLLGV